MENQNCKNCIRFKTCKFVEKNNDFAKQMYTMFKYAEGNNIDEIFYENAKNCKFYINNEVNIDGLLAKIQSAKWQIEWLKAYVASETRPAESTVKTLQRVINDYEKSLNQN